jgi:hypothetical protein
MPADERITRLLHEANAFYVQQGIPEEEITEDARMRYAWERLTPQEQEAAIGVTYEQLREDMAFAHFSVILDEVMAEEGEPPLPLGLDDPAQERRVREEMQAYRERLADEAYWDDETE